jgi:hypothetical protein
MRNHESRYKDGDLLTATQAAEVVSENSGHKISERYMAKLVELGKLDAPKVGRYHVYPYALIKEYVVSRASAGRKALPDDEVKPRSLYHREYMRQRRERERERQGERKPPQVAAGRA